MCELRRRLRQEDKVFWVRGGAGCSEALVSACGFVVEKAQWSTSGIDEDCATVVLVNGGSDALEAWSGRDGRTCCVLAPGAAEGGVNPGSRRLCGDGGSARFDEEIVDINPFRTAKASPLESYLKIVAGKGKCQVDSFVAGS